MAISKSYNNLTFSIPEAGEVGWSDLTFFLTELADAGQTVGVQFGATRTATTTPQNLSATNDHILVMNVASASTVNLPSGQVGQRFIVQDGSGAAGTNPITIVPAVGQTIDGDPSIQITNDNSSVEVVFGGSNTWRVIGQSTISSPTFTSVTISGLTANKLIATDASKTLVSVVNVSSPLDYDSTTTTLSIDLTNYITNSMVNTSAAISWSKMAVLADAQLLVGSGSNVATPRTITGAISINNTGVTQYVGTLDTVPAPTSDVDMNSNKITNVTDPTSNQDAATKYYVDTVAAGKDELSELNDTDITTPTSGQLIIWDGTDSWDNKSMSGDVTINSSGVTAISSNVIVDADVNSSAAIARSKLASGTADHVVINSGTGAFSSEAQLAVTRGGTSFGSYTAGDIIYASGTTALSKLAIGTSNYVLTSSGAAPAWSNNLTINDLTVTGTIDFASAGFDNGSALAPSIYFNDSTDIGFYRAATNELGITVNSANRLSIKNTDITATVPYYGTAVYTDDGSATVPAYSFTSDTDTGMYLGNTNTLAFTTAGSLAMHMDASYIYSDQAHAFSDGTVLLPGLTFINDANSGIYRIGADEFGLSTGGSLAFSVSSTANTHAQPSLHADGSVSAPSISFSSSTNTGIYYGVSNYIRFATGGSNPLNILSSEIDFNVKGVFPAGTVLLPSITFSGDTDTGIYQYSADGIGFTAGGSERFRIENTTATSQGPILGPAGSSSAPTFSFEADSNTGLYQQSAGVWALIADGSNSLAGSNSSITSYRRHYFQDGTSGVPGISFSGNTDYGFWRSSASGGLVGLTVNGAEAFRATATIVDFKMPISILGTTYKTTIDTQATSDWTFNLPVDAGSANQVLQTDGSGNLSWGSSLTNPMTTLGDIIYGGASGTPTRLGVGTAGQVLTVSGGVPSWQDGAAGTLDGLSDTDITTPANTDLLFYDGTDSWDNGTINDLTVDGSPDDANDYLMTYDASAGVHKKILLSAVSGTLGGTGTLNTIAKWTSSTDLGDSIMDEVSGDIHIGGGFRANNSGSHLFYYQLDNQVVGKYASATGDGFRYVGQYGISAVAGNREVVTLDGQAHDGTDWYSVGEINIVTNGTQSASNHGGYMTFQLVDNGGTSMSTKMTIVEDQVRIRSGSETLPAYTFGGDPDTGMWNSAANVLNFSVAGQEQLEISGSGIRIGDNYTIPLTDGTANQVLRTDGAGTVSWVTLSGTGDVVGPSSAADNHLVRFDGTTGKIIQELAGSWTAELTDDGELKVNNKTPSYATAYDPRIRVDREVTSSDAATTAGIFAVTSNDGTAPTSWTNFAAVITAEDHASRSTAASYNVGLFGEAFNKGSGNITYLEALRFTVYQRGTGTVSTANVVDGSIDLDTGSTTTDANGFYFRAPFLDGTCTNFRGLYLQAPTSKTGTVTNFYGIYEDYGSDGATNYWTSPHQSGDGSASTPTYSFNSDSNTGIYRSAADTLNISTGGTETVEFQTSSGANTWSARFNSSQDAGRTWLNTQRWGTLLAMDADTSAATIAGGFLIETSSSTPANADYLGGLFSVYDDAARVNGIDDMIGIKGEAYKSSTATIDTMRGFQFIVQNDESGTVTEQEGCYVETRLGGTSKNNSVTGLSLFRGKLKSTGSGTKSVTNVYGLKLEEDLATALTITNKYGVYENLGSGTINYWSGVHHAASGSASAPAYSFSADTDVGMYYDSALRFSVVGAEKWRMTGSYNYSAQTLQLIAGTAAAPALTFNTDTNTGIYRIAADELGIAVAGSECANFKDWGTGQYGIELGNSDEGIYESGGHLYLASGGSGRGYVGSTGGLVWGSPTGGDKGAGAINAQAVYDDNSLLTDYVFEKYYTGKPFDADKANYTMMTLEQEIEHTQEKYHLSTMVGRKEWEEEGKKSTGELINQLWETVETQFLYIKELKEELDEVKRRLN